MTRRRRPESDSGMTLVELIVAMGIFAIVLSVFMSSLVIMTRSAARAQAVADSGDAVRKTFQRMDKQIRYASSINYPGGGVSGAQYVEFRSDAAISGVAATCTQWRYMPSTRVVQLRTWLDATVPAASAWNTMVTNVRNPLTGSAISMPFVLAPADVVHTRQQLTVVLNVGPAARAGSDLRTTFVARNSSANSPSNADGNADLKSDNPICAAATMRP